jgi:hypothetical protein
MEPTYLGVVGTDLRYFGRFDGPVLDVRTLYKSTTRHDASCVVAEFYISSAHTLEH